MSSKQMGGMSGRLIGRIQRYPGLANRSQQALLTTSSPKKLIRANMSEGSKRNEVSSGEENQPPLGRGGLCLPTPPNK